MNIERLEEFRVVTDCPDLFHTVFKIKTTKNTYYDVWDFILKYGEEGETRIYEKSIVDWCRENNVFMICYDY